MLAKEKKSSFLPLPKKKKKKVYMNVMPPNLDLLDVN